MSNFIPLNELVSRRIYILDSRNLTYGVFDSRYSSFIGIRYKLGHRYLTSEIHWDADANNGTAKAIELIDEKLPDYISLKESYDTIDQETEELVYWKPDEDGVRGRWYSVKTKEELPKCKPTSYRNHLLFDFLDMIEKKYVKKET